MYTCALCNQILGNGCSYVRFLWVIVILNYVFSRKGSPGSRLGDVRPVVSCSATGRVLRNSRALSLLLYPNHFSMVP